VPEFSTEPGEEGEREVLFRVDGTEYTIPVEPPASIALAGMELLAAHGGGDMAQILFTREMLRLMLGDKGYAALLSVPTLKPADFTHLAEVCAKRAMGAIQESGNPNS
jgi:hypothetical protein